MRWPSGMREQRRLEVGREPALAKQQRGGLFLERAHDFGAVLEGDTVVESQEGVRQDWSCGQPCRRLPLPTQKFANSWVINRSTTRIVFDWPICRRSPSQPA